MKLVKLVFLWIAIADLVLFAILYSVMGLQWLRRERWTEEDERQARAAYLRSTPR